MLCMGHVRAATDVVDRALRQHRLGGCGQRHIDGIDQCNRATFAGIVAALVNADGDEFRIHDAKSRQDRSAQVSVRVVERQLDFGESQHRETRIAVDSAC